MSIVRRVKSDLPNFKYNDYLRNLQAVEEEAGIDAKPIRIAVLRSYTVEAIEPVLRLRLLLEGFRPEIFMGDYNRYVQEIVDPSSSLYSFRPDIVLLMVRIDELMPDFVHDFGSRPGVEWETAIRVKVDELRDLARMIEKTSSAQLIVQNICMPGTVYWGIFDTQTPDGQTYLAARFNQALAEALKERVGAFIWDFHRFVMKKGYDQIFDPKMWALSKNPYKQSVYPSLADDLMKYILSALGKLKKCIVLDLDNTLWGGIIGEDGLKGIQLGHDYPGNCFREFQRELLKLHHRGIILAINSKNNEADALAAIDSHPDMVLRRKHIAAFRINWNDKVSNLRALAEDLNIAVDSMVMIDDNPIECEQIRQQLPECAVICLPRQPYLIPHVLESVPGMENIRLTEEDRKKGQMYQAQIARRQHETACGSLDEFLTSLDLEISIDAAVSYSIPRIAQLTQKTNQMNLTTRRYTEAEIASFIEDAGTFIFSIASRDKFGDNGIVGVCILKFSGVECRIDTFLLSCRVIGRNIEGATMAFVSDFARKKGAKLLLGEYIPTTKNKPAEDMYDRFKFERVTEQLFKVDLDAYSLPSPSYIRVTVNSSNVASHH